MNSETASTIAHPAKTTTKTAFSRNVVVSFAIASCFGSVFSEEPRFKVGQSLESALQAKVTWSCVGAPLGEQLRDFQQQGGIAVLKDRRVDPHLLISMEANSVSRVQVLRAMTSSVPTISFCLTEHLAYVGPVETVQRLPILLVRNTGQVNALRKKLNAADFRKLSANISMTWDQLAEPRQILLHSARLAGVTISNPEIVPHDIWSEQYLPKMNFAELATTILNQFDMNLEFAEDSATVLIVPVNLQETFEYRYAVGSKLKSKVDSEWQSRFPLMKAKWTGVNAVATGTLEQHGLLHAVITELAIMESSSAQSAPIGSIRTTKFQLKAERASVGELIEYFRTNKVVIEVQDADLPATKAALAEIVQLREITDTKAGREFFPLIFGEHFKKVEVLDDRVILSCE